MGTSCRGSRDWNPKLLPLRGPLGRYIDCCDEETNDRSQQSRYGESRPFRLGHPVGRAGASATVTSATYGETDDCCEPEGECYSSRDPWYTQSQTSRPTYDVVWGSQQSRPMTDTGMSAAATWHPEGNNYSRTERHPVPLDAPDVALRGQRLMAYEERLRREEGQASQEMGRARPSSRAYRPPMERLDRKARVKRPRTPLLVDRLAEAEELPPPPPQEREAEPELFMEPRDAPEIG